MAVTTHMAAPLRDGVARAVAEIRIDDLDASDKLDTLLDRIKIAQDKRNSVSHDAWAIHPDSKKIFRVKKNARNSVSVSLIEASINEIKADAIFIHNAGMELYAFMRDQALMPKFPPVRPRGHRTKAERKKRRKQS